MYAHIGRWDLVIVIGSSEETFDSRSTVERTVGRLSSIRFEYSTRDVVATDPNEIRSNFGQTSTLCQRFSSKTISPSLAEKDVRLFDLVRHGCQYSSLSDELLSFLGLVLDLSSLLWCYGSVRRRSAESQRIIPFCRPMEFLGIWSRTSSDFGLLRFARTTSISIHFFILRSSRCRANVCIVYWPQTRILSIQNWSILFWIFRPRRSSNNWNPFSIFSRKASSSNWCKFVFDNFSNGRSNTTEFSDCWKAMFVSLCLLPASIGCGSFPMKIDWNCSFKRRSNIWSARLAFSKFFSSPLENMNEKI